MRMRNTDTDRERGDTVECGLKGRSDAAIGTGVRGGGGVDVGSLGIYRVSPCTSLDMGVSADDTDIGTDQ